MASYPFGETGGGVMGILLESFKLLTDPSRRPDLKNFASWAKRRFISPTMVAILLVPTMVATFAAGWTLRGHHPPKHASARCADDILRCLSSTGPYTPGESTASVRRSSGILEINFANTEDTAAVVLTLSSSLDVRGYQGVELYGEARDTIELSIEYKVIGLDGTTLVVQRSAPVEFPESAVSQKVVAPLIYDGILDEITIGFGTEDQESHLLLRSVKLLV